MKRIRFRIHFSNDGLVNYHFIEHLKSGYVVWMSDMGFLDFFVPNDVLQEAKMALTN